MNIACSYHRSPLPSRATRLIPARSRASLRGMLTAHLPGHRRARIIAFESRLEEQVLLLLLARPDVHDIWDQPPAITYVDADGATRRHVFDFLVTLTDGARVALAVKPWAIAERTGFFRRFELIRAATPGSYAGDARLVSERDFRRDDALNAARLHAFRGAPDPEADATVRDAVGPDERLSIAEIWARTGLKGRAYRAAFRGIFDGAFAQLDAGEIGPRTLIRRRAGA